MPKRVIKTRSSFGEKRRDEADRRTDGMDSSDRLRHLRVWYFTDWKGVREWFSSNFIFLVFPLVSFYSCWDFWLISSWFGSWHSVWLPRPTKDTMSQFQSSFSLLPCSFYPCILSGITGMNTTTTSDRSTCPSVSSIFNADNGSKLKIIIKKKHVQEKKTKKKIA
jgi:hypothetical protein